MKQDLLNYGKTWKIILNKQLHIIKHHSPVHCFLFSSFVFIFRNSAHLWICTELCYRVVSIWI